MSQGPPQIRIVAIGDGAVGKTCLLTVFKGDPFPVDYEPTIFENHHEMREYNGKTYNLHLWDTAGQEEYDRLRPMSYQKCDVVLLCFALDNPESFNNVTDRWSSEIKEYAPKASIVLVGTKSDKWDKAAITEEAIVKAAKDIKAYKSIQCSARAGENVGGVFNLAIEAFLSKNGDKCIVA